MKQAYMPQAKSDDWATPDRVYEEALLIGWDLKSKEFFDPCPLHADFDGLKLKWKEFNFINPPYKTLTLWVEKAWQEWAYSGHSSVLLLPVKTDQKWFQMYCCLFKIHFFQGRLKFKGAKHHATQPHMLVFMDARSQ